MSAIDRRTFFNAAVAAATVGAASGVAARQPIQSPPRLKVLMLGGTGFFGPTIVETLLDRGHDVTLFNRGVTNPHLFNYLEKLRGDREAPDGNDLGALRGRAFDVVIDTWQNGPKCVEDTARALSGQARAYFYISSIAVYHRSGFDAPGTVEDSRLSDLEGQTLTRSPDAQTYFLRKTLAETALRENFRGDVGVFRSHGLRGARIRTPASEHYWPVKLWRGGKVLAPEDGTTWGQFTDSVSLARFLAVAAETGLHGAYNVMSEPFRLGDYFAAIQNVTHRKADLVWTPREKLAEFGIEPYRDLPMWRPEPAGYYRFSTAKAVKSGFAQRSLGTCAAARLHGY